MTGPRMLETLARMRARVAYIALAAVANAGLTLSAAADPLGLDALREGDMRKMTVHAEPQPGSGAPFEGADGAEMTLAAYEGQVVLLNFWATWCAPCRHEMPALSQLQTELGGEDFAVVTVAAGRNAPEAMSRFFDEIAVDNLPLHRDPQQSLARQMGVLGLPVTILLDRDGQELARLQGGADWATDSARAIVRAAMGVEG